MREEPKSAAQKRKEGMVMVGGQWRQPTKGRSITGEAQPHGEAGGRVGDGKRSRRATLALEGLEEVCGCWGGRVCTRAWTHACVGTPAPMQAVCRCVCVIPV